MDVQTLRRLATRGNSKFIVPAGVGRLIRSAKLESVDELDWGDSLSLQLYCPLRPGSALLGKRRFRPQQKSMVLANPVRLLCLCQNLWL
jgi:hypothetical protein